MCAIDALDYLPEDYDHPLHGYLSRSCESGGRMQLKKGQYDKALPTSS
jgi:hypothetical protein